MTSLLATGLWLTVFGMGLVFLLLALLWGLVRMLLWLDRPDDVRKAEADEDLAAPASVPTIMAPQPAGMSPALLAAITMAVLLHRGLRRKQAAPLMRRHLPSTRHSRWVAAGRTRQNGSWQPTRR